MKPVHNEHTYNKTKFISNYTGKESVNTTTLATSNGTSFPLINLHVRATNLKDVDVVTVSDPLCALYIYTNNRWIESGRTEVVWNNLNPEWVTFFTVMYIFEIKQYLRFIVYDVDDNNANLSKQTIIGQAEVELSTIVSTGSALNLTLKDSKNKKSGQLLITTEQVENCSSVVNFKFTCPTLKRMRFFSSNHPFYVIAKSSESGLYIPIYQSEVSKKKNWKRATVPYQVFCNIDPNRPIRISVFDRRSFKASVLIGYMDTSFSNLCENVNREYDLINSKNKNVGKLNIQEISLQQRFSFYDYIHGGIQLNLIVGIDFTSSNGFPNEPRSLHYLDRSGDSFNQYQQCIKSVGEILCPYDTDQLFPVLGFGAKIGNQSLTQHCFPLTFDPQKPCVTGLDGILEVYQNALSQVRLSGPTLFAPLIRYANQLAVHSFQENRTYTILLILTDGIINDMQDTCDAIVEAGRLPLSIIIVGVGNANFEKMDVLDADDDPLISRTGEKECRDLVQFVPFNRFANQHYSILAAEVLEEVPRQLMEWAEMNGVKPT